MIELCVLNLMFNKNLNYGSHEENYFLVCRNRGPNRANTVLERLLAYGSGHDIWYLLTRVVPDKFQKSSETIVCVLYQGCPTITD